MSNQADGSATGLMGTDTGTTVRLRFSALPAHVRTARLVAAAVARRTGVDEAVLDEVRLAVGEACSRAVDLHRRHRSDEPVLVALTGRGTSFTVEVRDQVPDQEVGNDALATLTEGADGADGGAGGGIDDVTMDAAMSAGVGLAVIEGLVDDLVIQPGPSGTVVRMTWPLSATRA